MRSFPLPAGIPYDTLHDRLKDDGYIIYAGLGDAAQTTFRVCALGARTVEALQQLADALAHRLGAVAAADDEAIARAMSICARDDAARLVLAQLAQVMNQRDRLVELASPLHAR